MWLYEALPAPQPKSEAKLLNRVPFSPQMPSLILASTVTLGLLSGLFFVSVLIVAWLFDVISLPLLIGGTVLINLFTWLVGPYIQNIILRFFYKMRFMTIEELKQKDRQLAEFITGICAKEKFKVPKLGIIEDDNPTAFTYGSAAFNARVVLTEGLWRYLNKDELKAVVAHELGHIRNSDFIVMTIATTLVELLYQMYLFLRKSLESRGRSKGKHIVAVAALVVYIFYQISLLTLYYLSRVREYMADRFATTQIAHPDHLSMALVKIAYGIIAMPEGKETKSADLIRTTRALGLNDPKTAKGIGLAYAALSQKHTLIDNVLLFDIVSPWAKVLEWGSTHPLTGKRIRELSAIAQKNGLRSAFDFDEHLRKNIDYKRLYRSFFYDAIFFFLPLIFGIGAAIAGVITFDPRWLPIALGGYGLGMLIRATVKYSLRTPAKKTTVLELMSNIYASPLRGEHVELEGKVVGRGTAGYALSEDVMLQDRTGLMFLNYESIIPFFGNFIFALSKVKQLMGKSVRAEGWFFRGFAQHVDLYRMTDGIKIKSYVRAWAYISGLLLTAAGTYYTFILFL